MSDELTDKLNMIKQKLNRNISTIENEDESLTFSYKDNLINLKIKNESVVALTNINTDKGIFVIEDININDLVYIVYKIESHLKINENKG